MSPVVGAALTFDLTVTAPLATWWFGARKNRLSKRAPWVVLGLGLVAARFLLPPDARPFLRGSSVLLEILLVGMLLRAGKLRENFLPLRLLHAELEVMRYAFTGWFRRTPREDATTFSMRAGQHATLIGVFVFLIAGETALLHLLLSRWSLPAAWIATASSVWAALWLIGDAHALRLHPLRVTPEALEVTLGVRWRMVIPRDAIVSIGIPDETPALKATVLGRRDVMIKANRPLEAVGLFGRKRRFDAVVLSVDRPEELMARGPAPRSI